MNVGTLRSRSYSIMLRIRCKDASLITQALAFIISTLTFSRVKFHDRFTTPNPYMSWRFQRRAFTLSIRFSADPLTQIEQASRQPLTEGKSPTDYFWRRRSIFKDRHAPPRHYAKRGGFSCSVIWILIRWGEGINIYGAEKLLHVNEAIRCCSCCCCKEKL